MLKATTSKQPQPSALELKLPERQENATAVLMAIQEYKQRRDAAAIADIQAGRTPNERQARLQNKRVATLGDLGTSLAEKSIAFTKRAIALEEQIGFIDRANQPLVHHVVEQYDQLAQEASKEIETFKRKLKGTDKIPLTVEDVTTMESSFLTLAKKGHELDRSKKHIDLAIQLDKRVKELVDISNSDPSDSEQVDTLIELYTRLSDVSLRMLEGGNNLTSKAIFDYKPLLRLAEQALEAHDANRLDIESLCHHNLIVSDQVLALREKKEQESDPSIIQNFDKAITAHNTANAKRNKIIESSWSEFKTLQQAAMSRDKKEANRLLLILEQNKAANPIDSNNLTTSAALNDRFAESYLKQADYQKALQNLPAEVKANKEKLLSRANGILTKISSFQQKGLDEIERGDFFQAEDAFPKIDREFESLNNAITALQQEK